LNLSKIKQFFTAKEKPKSIEEDKWFYVASFTGVITSVTGLMVLLPIANLIKSSIPFTTTWFIGIAAIFGMIAFWWLGLKPLVHAFVNLGLYFYYQELKDEEKKKHKKELKALFEEFKNKKVVEQ
jgi:hypothetical protein